MAHTLTGGYQTAMSATVQKYLEKIELFRKLASFREESVLTKGVAVNRPYRTGFTAAAYTANTDLTATDTTLTSSTLTVDQSQGILLKIDPVEDVQLQTNPGSLRALYAPRMSKTLAQLHDRDFFNEYSNAALALDEHDYASGSAVNDPIDLATVPVDEVYLDAFATLGQNDIGVGGKFAVVDNKILAAIAKRGLATGFQLSDTVFNNGFTGGKFAGFDLYVSENLVCTQSFTLLAGTENGTFTLNGVTFTAKDALGVTAGNIYTNSATLDTFGTNLAKAINGDATSTFYVEVSAFNREKLKARGITAVYTANTDTLAITSYGRIKVTFSTGVATALEQTINSICGQYGCIDMVVQLPTNIQFNKATNNLGSSLIAHTLWGTKTFEDGAQRLLTAKIKG